jgi:hypothetical protein
MPTSSFEEGFTRYAKSSPPTNVIAPEPAEAYLSKSRPPSPAHGRLEVNLGAFAIFVEKPYEQTLG